MANEATMIQRLQDRLSECTVADGVAIAKGTILKLSDPNTGAASSADGDIFVGIAATGKEANDGQTRMSIWTKGIFDLKCDAVGVTAGSKLKIGGANLVSTADVTTAADFNEHFAVALQTGAASEVIEVRLL